MHTQVQKHNRRLQAIKHLTISVIDDTFSLRHTFLVQLCQQPLQKKQTMGKPHWRLPARPSNFCSDASTCGVVIKPLGLVFDTRGSTMGQMQPLKHFNLLANVTTLSLINCPFYAAAINICAQVTGFRGTLHAIFPNSCVHTAEAAGCGQYYTEFKSLSMRNPFR